MRRLHVNRPSSRAIGESVDKSSRDSATLLLREGAAPEDPRFSLNHPACLQTPYERERASIRIVARFLRSSGREDLRPNCGRSLFLLRFWQEQIVCHEAVTSPALAQANSIIRPPPWPLQSVQHQIRRKLRARSVAGSR